jgi:hypothetical protein
LLAVGNDGVFYRREGQNWIHKSLATSKHIYNISAYSGGYYLVGQAGYFTYVSLPGASSVAQAQQLTLGVPVEENVGEDLYSVTNLGTKVYAVGQNGRYLYSPNGLTQAFAKMQVGNQDLNSVTTRALTGKVYAFGEDAQLIEFAGANALVKKTVFVPAIRDVHFVDGANGSFVADNMVVRQTSNQANSFEIIQNTGTTIASTENLTAVWTVDANLSLILGSGPAQLVNNGAWQTIATGTNVFNIRDIDRKGDNILLVKGNQLFRYSVSGNAFTTLATTLSQLRSVSYAPNGTYVVLSQSGNAVLYAPNHTALWTTTVGMAQFNKVLFVTADYLVAVGNNGVYAKATDLQFNAQNQITGGNWEQQHGTYAAGSDPYFVTAMNMVDITTIAFASPTKGVFGGRYNGTFPIGVNQREYPYVRRVSDPNSRYSARFYYDRLGRLVVSQNGRQASANQAEIKYSYTLYDAHGRVVEAGEKTENSTYQTRFASVYGAMVADYYNPNVIDDSKLLAWVNGDGARKEVTHSFYDATVLAGLPANFTPDVLTQRKRITQVAYYEELNKVAGVYDYQDYDHATHYDYDIHGNVKTLLQDNRKMAQEFATLASQQFKRMDYVYDLVSGNVHRVMVQSGNESENEAASLDEWNHAYRYDADNRITEAYTSKETPFITVSIFNSELENELIYNEDWQNDARYFYYDHGPLARVELGDDNLQGLDYVYTLQGWLKGVNATNLDGMLDPGKDAVAGLNSSFAKDVYSFGLSYYGYDYAGIAQSPSPFANVDPNSHAAQNSSDLYNGNIRFMQTTITNPNTREVMPMVNAYKYDQLNRLRESRSYETGLEENVWNPISYSQSYYNEFVYDANGNILFQTRHLRNGDQIEKMHYRYKYDANNRLLRNRLYHINDGTIASLDTKDIDDQGEFVNDETIETANNYVRDEEGRLIKNKQEEIAEIVWRVDGKVKEIRRTAESLRKNITFDYDAMGNQIAKHIINNQTGMLERSTYYVLDAQGNQMNVYSHDVTAENVSYKLIERSIFGASMLGTDNTEIDMFAENQSTTSQVHLGNKYYSLSDHRGNVNTVIKDIKIPIALESDDEPFEDLGDAPYFNADGTIKFDELTVHPAHTCVNPGLNFVDGPTNAFPIFEDANGDGNIDMKVRGEVPINLIPTRLFFYTTPGQNYTLNFEILSWMNVGIIGVVGMQCGNPFAAGQNTIYTPGTYSYSFTATGAQTEIKWNIFKQQASLPGEITFTNFSLSQGTGPFFSQPLTPPVDPDSDISHYEVAIVSVADYSPFNVELDGRTIKNDFYRRSVQGQEHHDEILGEGNYINYKYRGYDPRIGRLDWSIDPLSAKFPFYTSYQFSGNKVINSIEFEGLEDFTAIWGDPTQIAQVLTAYYNNNNRSPDVNQCSFLFIGSVNSNPAWVYRPILATERVALNLDALRNMTEPAIVDNGRPIATNMLSVPSTGATVHIAHTGQVNPNTGRASSGVRNMPAGAILSPNTVQSVVQGNFSDGNITQIGTLVVPPGFVNGNIQISGTANLIVTLRDNLGGVVYSGTISGFAGTVPTLTPGSTSINVTVNGSTNTSDNFNITTTISGTMQNATNIPFNSSTSGSTTSTNTSVSVIQPVPITSSNLQNDGPRPANYKRTIE